MDMEIIKISFTRYIGNNKAFVIEVYNENIFRILNGLDWVRVKHPCEGRYQI